MKRFTRRAAVVGVIAGLAAVTSPISPAQAATDIRVGVGSYQEMGAIQYAIDSGIMAKNGLNVTLQPFAAPPAALAALAGGNVEFAYAPAIPIINAYTNGGVALKMVAPSHGLRPSVLGAAKKNPALAAKLDNTGVCVSPTAGINRWKDLSGKRVVVPARKAQGEVVIASAVKRDGGDPSTIQWAALPLAAGVDAIRNGQADAAYTVEPFVSACVAGGLKNLGQPGVAFYTIEKSIGAWVTTAPYAAANPAVVAAFQKSMFQAHTFAMASAANAKIVNQASGKITKLAPEVIASLQPMYYPLQLTLADVQTQAGKMASIGYLSKPFDAKGLLLRQYRP